MRRLLSRLVGLVRRLLLIPEEDRHEQARVEVGEPASAPRSAPETTTGRSLRSLYEERMWWKELRHHQGVGSLPPEEQDRLQRRYEEESRRLSRAVEEERRRTVRRWVEAGMTASEAERRWDAVDDETYRECRLEYALQKD